MRFLDGILRVSDVEESDLCEQKAHPENLAPYTFDVKIRPVEGPDSRPPNSGSIMFFVQMMVTRVRRSSGSKRDISDGDRIKIEN